MPSKAKKTTKPKYAESKWPVQKQLDNLRGGTVQLCNDVADMRGEWPIGTGRGKARTLSQLTASVDYQAGRINSDKRECVSRLTDIRERLDKIEGDKGPVLDSCGVPVEPVHRYSLAELTLDTLGLGERVSFAEGNIIGLQKAHNKQIMGLRISCLVLAICVVANAYVANHEKLHELFSAIINT